MKFISNLSRHVLLIDVRMTHALRMSPINSDILRRIQYVNIGYFLY
mgnify:CR=1 FL=1